MNDKPRWQQRFEYFSKAYKQFTEVVSENVDDLSELEKEGFVQRFEYTYELAWKTLQDYLTEEGYDLNSPKEVLRQAFKSEIIANGEVWMEAAKKRNLTSHTYNEELLDETVDFLINKFYPELEKIYRTLEEKINQ